MTYTARGEVIHFCRVGIAHQREPSRPKTVGDAHPTMAQEGLRRWRPIGAKVVRALFRYGTKGANLACVDFLTRRETTTHGLMTGGEFQRFFDQVVHHSREQRSIVIVELLNGFPSIVAAFGLTRLPEICDSPLFRPALESTVNFCPDAFRQRIKVLADDAANESPSDAAILACLIADMDREIYPINHGAAKTGVYLSIGMVLFGIVVALLPSTMLDHEGVLIAVSLAPLLLVLGLGVAMSIELKKLDR